MVYLFYLFFPFVFSLFLYLLFFSVFGLSVGLLFSPSVFLFLPDLAGGDFGALDGDFLPRITLVHPSFFVIGVVPSLCQLCIWNVSFLRFVCCYRC